MDNQLFGLCGQSVVSVLLLNICSGLTKKKGMDRKYMDNMIILEKLDHNIVGI